MVSEAGRTWLQDRMHVPGEVEDWVIGRIQRWRADAGGRSLLLMLSGNAGDGKSDLIDRVLGSLEVTADIKVVRDATHADRPSENQIATLAEFFSPFADEAVDRDPAIHLIAINTGMVLSFLGQVGSDPDLPSFDTLRAVVTADLLLVASSPLGDVGWQHEIVNLDRRSLLRSGQLPSLIDGAFTRLDPYNADSIFGSESEACETCAAKHVCFVRTNLELLRLESAREAIKSYLWDATLGGDVHLSPRNLWDFLYHIVTGGAEFFDGYDSYCDRIAELAHGSGDQIPLESVVEVHRRLLYNLLFEPADERSADRGPLVAAVAAADPLRRTGQQAHEAESAVYADPRVDSGFMEQLARVIGEARPPEGRTSEGGSTNEVVESDPVLDPCLAMLSRMLPKAAGEHAEERDRVARGVTRRAAVTSVPPAIQGELHDYELDEFLGLLGEYATWRPGSAAPHAIVTFASELVEGIRAIFGVALGGRTYFRQDAFSPATRYPAFVEVDLRRVIEPDRDPDIVRGSGWLSAVQYLPSAITVQISVTDDQAWHVRADLPLYRLIRKVTHGYSASSVDLETFFALRFACERLGSARPEASELVLRDTATGTTYRVEERTQFGMQLLEFGEVHS